MRPFEPPKVSGGYQVDTSLQPASLEAGSLPGWADFLSNTNFETVSESLSENSEGCCFCAQAGLAGCDEGSSPTRVCDRGTTTPDRLGRENLLPSPFGLWRDKPGGGAFALGLCCRRRDSPLPEWAEAPPRPRPKSPAAAHFPIFRQAL